MPPRSSFLVPTLCVLLCLMAGDAFPSTGLRVPLNGSSSITTVPCPLLRPAEILERPRAPERGVDLAQRAIARPSASVSVSESGDVSAGKAILLSAVAPGAGHIYSGYDRGYLYLGVEAVAWISYLVLREDGNRRADQAESYAGDPFGPESRWSFERYGDRGFCNVPGGSAADSTLRDVWSDDRSTFYDLIESDPSYRCGWEGAEEWTEFREMRSNSEDLLRWARYAGAAVILNRAIAVLDMVRLSRGFEIPGGANVRFKVNPSLPHPSGSIRVKKAF